MDCNHLQKPWQCDGTVKISPEGRCKRNSAAQSFLPAGLPVIPEILLYFPNLFPSGLEEEMTVADVEI